MESLFGAARSLHTHPSLTTPLATVSPADQVEDQTTVSTASNEDKVAVEIMVQIFSNLNLRSLFSSACVSKQWNFFAGDTYVLREVVRRTLANGQKVNDLVAAEKDIAFLKPAFERALKEFTAEDAELCQGLFDRMATANWWLDKEKQISDRKWESYFFTMYGTNRFQYTHMREAFLNALSDPSKKAIFLQVLKEDLKSNGFTNPEAAARAEEFLTKESIFDDAYLKPILEKTNRRIEALFKNQVSNTNVKRKVEEGEGTNKRQK